MREICFLHFTFFSLWRFRLGRGAARGCCVQTLPSSSCPVSCKWGEMVFPTGWCCCIAWRGGTGKRLSFSFGKRKKTNPHLLQSPSPMGKTRITQRVNHLSFAPKYEDITGAYAGDAGKKGVKTTLQHTLMNQKHLLNYTENYWNTPERSLRRGNYLLRQSWLRTLLC